MRKILLLFLYFLPILGLSSESSVVFLQDPRVDVLLHRSIESNRAVTLEGFRINIFFQSGNLSRSNALAAQTAFSEQFPEMKSYVSFEEPYFRVNVGNFRTRLQAEAVVENLRRLYPQAHVVRDVLNIVDLLQLHPEEEEYDEEENDDDEEEVE
ncbi:MAG: SPOR domain-containing protein [Bacteroidales bacterium]|nr:SPOR domain-containing protein [Bacteroidales bacterium]